jgi:hypothetical protein
MTFTHRLLAPTILLLFTASLVFAQQPAIQERVVALKASLTASQAILKQYEWVETTVISLKGEEKSRQMDRCYHGADGKVQKVPLTAPAPTEKKRGLRGRIAEVKKEELTETMKAAVALVKEYMPPQPVLIQRAKDAGKVTIQPLPGERVTLIFNDYLKPGDSLAMDMDLASNRPLEARISSFLDSQKDPVTLNVRFGTLDNNATYVSAITLNAQGANLTVNVQNSGYRRL